MKKLIVCLAIFAVVLSAVAQEKQDVSRFYGGVRVGFTASQISGDDLSGFHQLGASAGLFVNHAVNASGSLKLQLELDFTMKGSHSYTPPKQQYETDFYSLRLGYVEVPLLLEWAVGKWTLWGKPFQFELEVGPAFGVVVLQKEWEATGLIVGRPPFRRFEFSGIAGLSIKIADHHSVNLRYSNSIIPVRIPTWVYGRVIKKQFNSLIITSYCYQF
ncbi:MAG: PorT family protein [Bacteroidales bacterium]|nr:PorT family protein [Bacteroidales bacterium]